MEIFDGFREKSPFSAEKSHCSQSSSIIAFKFFRLFVERKDKKNFLSSESILQPLAFVKIDKMYGYPDAISRIINCHLCIKQFAVFRSPPRKDFSLPISKFLCHLCIKLKKPKCRKQLLIFLSAGAFFPKNSFPLCIRGMAMTMAKKLVFPLKKAMQ